MTVDGKKAALAGMAFDVTDAPVASWQEWQWMFDRIERFGTSCQSIVRVDDERGDLEMRFVENERGTTVKVTRHEPRRKGTP